MLIFGGRGLMVLGIAMLRWGVTQFEEARCRIGFPRALRGSVTWDWSRRGHSAYRGVARLRMISDIDIWRCAALMIKHYGDTADIEAASKADEFLAQGQLDGQRLWMRIAKAIDELQQVQKEATKHKRAIVVS